jgi:hypothetical protein
MDADLQGGCDSIPHPRLLGLVARERADGNVVHLLQKFLQAGVREEGAVVRQVNRVIRGTVRSLATAFTTGVGQCNALDRWIRRRLRWMTEKRLGQTANRRVQRRPIQRRGFGLCREVDLRAREGEHTDSSQGALAWGPPAVKTTHAGP